MVIKSVRERLKSQVPIGDGELIRAHVARVEVQPGQLVIHLAQTQETDGTEARVDGILHVPWHKPPSKRRREILLPAAIQPQHARPIRSETRATLVASIARGRRWLDELIADPTADTGSIAKREGCCIRKVNMMISLAFLAPDLVKAAIEGRLPRRMGVARLVDMPAEWSRQREVLGLPAQ
jgi:site-specific DNA recombinase